LRLDQFPDAGRHLRGESAQVVAAVALGGADEPADLQAT
jgi:hypothetical protein